MAYGKINVGSTAVKPQEEQKINYTMLYDQGNECTEITGGWDFTYCTKNTDSFTMSFTSANANANQMYTASVNNVLNSYGYSKMVVNYKSVSISTGQPTNGNKPFSVWHNAFNSSNWDTNRLAYYTSSFDTGLQTYDIGGLNTLKPYFMVNGWKSISCYATVTIGNVFLVKEDNYQTWISKAGLSTETYTTLESVIEDSNALNTLMNDKKAVQYMLLNCTGTVMASVIQSELALSIIQASDYNDLIWKNEHWAKFLTMVGEKPTSVNYTMLYDGSLGEAGENGVNICANVSGGFELLKKTGAGTLEFNQNCLTLINNTNVNSDIAVFTKNKIDLSGYIGIYALQDVSITGTITQGGFLSNVMRSKIYSGTNDTVGKTTTAVNATTSVNKHFSYTTDFDTTSGYPYSVVYVPCTTSRTIIKNIYSWFMVKDDISNYERWITLAGLSTDTYTTLDSVLADTTALNTLMNNELAVKYMLTCTGTLMSSIIQNKNALSAIFNSNYNKEIWENAHWSKFLSMVDEEPYPEVLGQVVNYTMLYDGSLGTELDENGIPLNECGDITGGWLGTSYGTNAIVTKNTDHIHIHSYQAQAYTTNKIDMSSYHRMFAITETKGWNTTDTAVNGQSFNKATESSDCVYGRFSEGNHCSNADTHVGFNVNKTTAASYIFDFELPEYFKGNHYIGVNSADGTAAAYIKLYNLVILKEDNWQSWLKIAGLSLDTYTTLDSVLANTTALTTLMNNEKAVNYMLTQCTGTVMASVIQNETALNIIGNSVYCDKIMSNSHWKKFLDMVGFVPILTVTTDVINKGTFRNGSHTLLTNQQNGSDGFTLVGKRNAAATTTCYVNELISWSYKIDLTDYNELSFYARKNVNHGSLYVCVLSDMSSLYTQSLAAVRADYTILPTTWKQYTLDISAITGEQYIVFIGGYFDMSGNDNSSTSYCDIQIR